MDDLLDIDAKLHINCIRFIQHLIENNTSQTDVATAVVVQVGWIVRVFNEYHTSYLSQSSHVRHVEKNLSCGEISDFYTWQSS